MTEVLTLFFLQTVLFMKRVRRGGPLLLAVDSLAECRYGCVATCLVRVAGRCQNGRSVMIAAIAPL